jgi:glycosyltransferase involved in cell wall biosynthesis
MLVSVVIPTYNHDRFLPDAINSIKNQDYKDVEIIVLDDGSTDSTPGLIKGITGVIYVRQENKGLSAARNAGFKHSSGSYLVFLDADDLLYPTAISSNLAFLHADPELAFVSGCHNMVDVSGSITDNSISSVEGSYYTELLRRNYIGMNGAVMYTRKTMELAPFDETLKACEDYDQYLRVARKYKVLHHNGKIAAYRKHDNNMSSDPGLMLHEVIKVLNRQKPLLRSDDEKQAYDEGIHNWKGKYLPKLYGSIFEQKNGKPISRKMTLVLQHWYPFLKMYVRKLLKSS